MVTLQPSYLVSRGLARSSTNYRWRLRSTGSLQLRGFGHLQNAENMVIVSEEDKPNTENNTFPFTQSLTVAILRKVPKNYNENRNNIEAPSHQASLVTVYTCTWYDRGKGPRKTWCKVNKVWAHVASSYALSHRDTQNIFYPHSFARYIPVPAIT